MAARRRQEADREKLQSLVDLGPLSRQAAAAALEACGGDFLAAAQVRKTLSWPRSGANFSLLWLCSH